MVFVKSKPEYTEFPVDFKPGPRYGYASTIDAEYAAVEEATEEALKPMWGGDVPMDKFKEAWATAPPAIPEDCPVPGKDVILSHTQVPVSDGTAVEIKIYRPPVFRPKSALVFRMHGGGWTVGAHETEEAENLYFGALPNVVVVSVGYRMAPEYPFPYPINDSWDVLKWCKSNWETLGIDPERIILAGNSGGGNMAVCIALRAKQEGLTGIVAQSVVFPVTCHPKFFDQVPNRENYELLSYFQNANAGIVNSARMEFFWDCYLGKDPKPDTRHSPLLHTIDALKGLPPALVQVGGVDPLRDEGLAYAEAMKAAGNDVTVKIWAGLPHCFYMFTGFKSTKEYFKGTIDFVKKFANDERVDLKNNL
ncbi:alpha/beta hydrolase fold-3 domain-containing protein [Xylariales sp. PMI_506]|nr:alpha/beta hydrolase fold-3 domain-containing protein [Xylariales sp. PMI_506]